MDANLPIGISNSVSHFLRINIETVGLAGGHLKSMANLIIHSFEYSWRQKNTLGILCKEYFLLFPFFTFVIAVLIMVMSMI